MFKLLIRKIKWELPVFIALENHNTRREAEASVCKWITKDSSVNLCFMIMVDKCKGGE